MGTKGVFHRSVLVALALVAAFVLAGCSKPAADPAAPKPGAKAQPQQPGAAMVLTSTAFQEGAMIPAAYTGDGKDVSPPLAWSGAPKGTVTFALIMDDPDARLGPFVHWLICEISGNTQILPEAMPKGDVVTAPISAVQGVNSFKNTGYGGPHPPKSETHRYFFKLYALDAALEMPGGFSKKQLEEAMKDHILAQATLMGKYGR